MKRLNRDIRLYLLANGLSGFTVDGGIYAVVMNLYLLRLGYGAQFIDSSRSSRPPGRWRVSQAMWWAACCPPLFAFMLSASPDEAAPYRYSLWLAPVSLLPAAVLMFTTRPVTREPMNESMKAAPVALALPAGVAVQIGMLALARFLFVLGCGAVLIFLNMYLDKDLGAGATGIGLLLGAGRLCAGAMSMLAPVLAARWSKSNLILGTVVGTVLSMIPLILLAQTSAAALSFVL